MNHKQGRCEAGSARPYLLLQPRNPLQVDGQVGRGVAHVGAFQHELEGEQALGLVQGHGEDVGKLVMRLERKSEKGGGRKQREGGRGGKQRAAATGRGWELTTLH